MCSSNGLFVRQPSGSFDYEGGEVRLVIVSSASSLAALKEALDRVVNRHSHSKSMSGPPKVRARRLPLRPKAPVAVHAALLQAQTHLVSAGSVPSDPTPAVDMLSDILVLSSSLRSSVPPRSSVGSGGLPAGTFCL